MLSFTMAIIKTGTTIWFSVKDVGLFDSLNLSQSLSQFVKNAYFEKIDIIKGEMKDEKISTP